MLCHFISYVTSSKFLNFQVSKLPVHLFYLDNCAKMYLPCRSFVNIQGSKPRKSTAFLLSLPSARWESQREFLQMTLCIQGTKKHSVGMCTYTHTRTHIRIHSRPSPRPRGFSISAEDALPRDGPAWALCGVALGL